MRIFINFTTGNYIPLQILPNDLISTVKSTIEEQKGIPSNEQELTFRGHILEDTKTIEFYSIQEDSALCISVQKGNISNNEGLITLFVSVPNRKLTFYVKPTDTIKDVKKMTEDEVALPASGITFTYEGHILEDKLEIGETFKNESTIYYIPTKID